MTRAVGVGVGEAPAVGAVLARALDRDSLTRYLLRLLGVERGAQGRCLGGRLLAHRLRRADESGHPSFLETFAEVNVPF